MIVPFYDFKSLHNHTFQQQAKERISKILEDNSFVEGEFNTKFEEDFSSMQKNSHCLLVANGTDALEISLKASDIKEGDLVGLPGITFFATAEAIINVGAQPVFIDVSPSTGLMCPKSFSRVASNYNLKAVIPVHIYGLPAPIPEIEEIAESHNISIIEDAAQAFGAFYDKERSLPIGSGKNLVTFSFYPTKNLSAMGDAGAILTNCRKTAEKIKSLRNHGRGSNDLVGRNSRCDHLQAAVLHLKLQNAEKLNDQRKNVAKLYYKHLPTTVGALPEEKFLELSSWHLFPLKLESSEVRKALQKHLQEASIGCAPYYERSMSQEPALKSFFGEREEAEKLAGRVLCLPMTPFLDEKSVLKVSDNIKMFFDTQTKENFQLKI